MTEDQKTYGDWRSIPQIARKLLAEGYETTDQKLRRCVNDYPMFFRCKLVDGVRHYPESETMEVFQKIKSFSGSGKKKYVVLAQLRESGLKEYTERESDQDAFADTDDAFSFSMPEGMGRELARIADAGERIAEALEQMAVVKTFGED